MGIPALFRWLSTKYSKISSQVVEEQPKEINGHIIPVDVTKPNPNNTEFDNLYLDMNGIIHPCCHPEDKPAPETEDEMMVEIFKYIDRIVRIIRPRKVLYMAIDGVAPRAKMNQQRSRRFRASQEAQEKADEEDRIRKEWEANGERLPEDEKRKIPFDSNCITPGTPFMTNLAKALRFYINDRLNTNPGWQNLKIILSDASVPGEGEHKIMDYIRRQRSQPDHDPNCSHVLYGLDADLIMLALATHEPHFKILREDVFFNQNNGRGCFICGQTDHQASECTGKKKEKAGQYDEKGNYVEKPYVFLHVEVLREYLEAELKEENLPFAWDLERAIDDWVFLCFFVGNDFLPHLPSLEIREGAIDRLIEIWRRNLHKFGGYLTDSGDIDLTRVQLLLGELGHVEDEIFLKRREDENRKRENRRRRKQEMQQRKEDMGQKKPRYDSRKNQDVDPMSLLQSWTPQEKADYNKNTLAEKATASLAANKAAAEALKASLLGKPAQPDTPNSTDMADVTSSPADVVMDDADTRKRKASSIEGSPSKDEETVEPIEEEEDADVDDDVDVVEELTVADVPIPKTKEPEVDSDAEPEDNVKLWEPGWKNRYYEKKFHIDPQTDRAFIREIVTKYVEGFCWVLKYYYQGVQSWKWFFPYHYSPFASDFDFIGELKIEFDLGTPFKPFEQLMGVLPAASRAHIPTVYHPLMLNEDSPIIDFYPEKFPIDLNGKKYAWQGVALLTFIDEARLLEAMEPYNQQLSEDEVIRNSKGEEYLFVGQNNRLFETLCALYARRSDDKKVELDATSSGRMLGSVRPDEDFCIPGSTFESPFGHLGLNDISENRAISAVYDMPQVAPKHVFKARLLPLVSFPPKQLTGEDIYWVRLGGKPSRGRGGGRGGRGGNAAASRFIRHGLNQYSSQTPGGLPYMGGGGYNVYNYDNGNSYSGYGQSSGYGGNGYNQGYNIGGGGSGGGGGGQGQGYSSYNNGSSDRPRSGYDRGGSGGHYSDNSGYDRSTGGYDRNSGYSGSRDSYSGSRDSYSGGRDSYSRNRDSSRSYNNDSGRGYGNSDRYSDNGGSYGSPRDSFSRDSYSGGHSSSTSGYGQNRQSYGSGSVSIALFFNLIYLCLFENKESNLNSSKAGYGGGYVPNASGYMAVGASNTGYNPGSAAYGSLYGAPAPTPAAQPPPPGASGYQSNLAPESWMNDIPGYANLMQSQSASPRPPVLAWNRNVNAGSAAGAQRGGRGGGWSSAGRGGSQSGRGGGGGSGGNFRAY
ncbi:5'-3' exoribonuclease 2 [Phlyctochytrium planicorne]|nr:5'-3' exoribonuclease 2 [Phlyctochytrium planicorne]